MAEIDFQRSWRLGVPGCNIEPTMGIRRSAIQLSGDEACKAVRKLFLPFKVPGFAISIQIGRATKEKSCEGLEWVQDDFRDLAPRWTVEPDLEAVRRAVEAIYPFQKVSVTFLAKGAFNKVYSIRSEQRECSEQHECIMRVSLPLDPKWKTLSEVATLKWIRGKQLLPVPEVFEFACETSRDNPVGFEWILMSKVPGRPLADIWRSMSLEAKKMLVVEMAIYSSRNFQTQLRGIGNIYRGVSKAKACSFSMFKSKEHDEYTPEVKRIVSMQFFWGDHIWQKISRGPFRSSKDWLSARLSLSEHDCHSTLARYEGKNLGSDDESDVDVKDGASRTLSIVRRLRDLLKHPFSPFSKQDTDGTMEHLRARSCYPSFQHASEPSMLFHDDLNMHNILVNKAGALTGVIDWECVSSLPLWKACDYPTFLEGLWTDIHVKPDKASYPRTIPDDDEKYGEEERSYWHRRMS